MSHCSLCQTTFEISPTEKAIYQKADYPLRNLCFECDQKRRLCFRNERALYPRKCDATGAKIISIYSEDKPYQIYHSDYWYSDKWDALDFGQEFDFNRPFFDQFKELQLKVPRLALSNIKGENSDYCNMTYGNKNCYLIFGGDYNHDCMFGTLCMHNVNNLDLDYSNRNELCYQLCDSINCYGCQFTFDSKNCHDCYFISDCIGCHDCIFCTNLINKTYHIQNQSYSKKDYFEKKKELINDSYSQQQKNWHIFLNLRQNRIVKYAHAISCQNCTGDYLKNSKNCQNCYDTSNSEDMLNIIFASQGKDCFNCSLVGDGSEVCYNCVSTFSAHYAYCSYFTIDSSQIEYSEFSLASQNLFGCIGLRHKTHCILNKQYSPEEYVALRKKIIEHMKKTEEWGQFFPPELSCFAYNETSAYDYFPIDKETALAHGYRWKDENDVMLRRPEGPSRSMRNLEEKPVSLPNNLQDTPNSIVNEILTCQTCQKNYKIVPQELKFYRKLKLPIPRQCPDCRHKLRMSIRNPRQLWPRQCQKCNVAVQSSYAPDRPETVYCERCYLKNIV